MILKEELDREGYAILSDLVSASEADQLLVDLLPLTAELALGGRGGVRNVLGQVPRARYLASSGRVGEIVAAVLGPNSFAVRAILFDKTPAANWKVPWHQDLHIAVKSQEAVEGFGPWTLKAGVPHVQAPAAILSRMLAVRVPLDDCGPENGPLRVIPGSHRAGKLGAEDIESFKATRSAARCDVPRGGLMLMRPLLLHASSPASSPGHRRVLHIEYAAEDLPGGLEWRDRAPCHP